jgi:hypothetical protein
MQDELMAVREAVNNTCKFLGPGSRTGNKLEVAMLQLERAVQGAPATEAGADDQVAQEPFDNGPWTYRTDPKAASHAGRYFVESDDFSHDVRLYINGDFGCDDDRRKYGEALARTLNAAARVAARGHVEVAPAR